MMHTDRTSKDCKRPILLKKSVSSEVAIFICDLSLVAYARYEGSLGGENRSRLLSGAEIRASGCAFGLRKNFIEIGRLRISDFFNRIDPLLPFGDQRQGLGWMTALEKY
jgi:hypothetical protein